MTTHTSESRFRSATWVLALASVASLMAALDAMVVSAALSLVGAIAGLGLPGRLQAKRV